MSQRIRTYTSGVTCDYNGCDKTIDGPELNSTGYQHYEDEAVRSGWTIWVSRRRQHRCPEHPMAATSKARLVAGEAIR